MTVRNSVAHAVDTGASPELPNDQPPWSPENGATVAGVAMDAYTRGIKRDFIVIFCEPAEACCKVHEREPASRKTARVLAGAEEASEVWSKAMTMSTSLNPFGRRLSQERVVLTPTTSSKSAERALHSAKLVTAGFTVIDPSRLPPADAVWVERL